METVSERKAEIVGKPNPQLLLTALDRLGEGRTLVVGDRADADLAAAAGAELDAALVKTGGQDERDAADGRPARRWRWPSRSPRSYCAEPPLHLPRVHAHEPARLGIHVQARAGRRRERRRRVLAAGLVKVGRAQRRRRIPVRRSPCIATAPLPRSSRRSSAQQLLQRRRRVAGGPTGTWRQPTPAAS